MKYKNFASEYDKVLAYNSYDGLSLDKNQFATILIQCGFISNNKLNDKYKLEFTLGLPMVTLLWNILIKLNQRVTVSKQPQKAKRQDIFPLLAAILGL